MPDIIMVLVNGLPYEGWKVYESTHSFEHASGGLRLTISPQPGRPMPIKIGDDIQAIVAGTPVLTGNVREVEGDDDWDHKDDRVIIAHDKTEDFLSSTVGPQKPVKPPADLQQILQKAVTDMGLSFSVLDNVTPDKFQDGEVPVASVDETGHAFGDRMARQRQTLLNTDGKGNLVIDRNKGDKRGPGMLFRADPMDPRNILNNILKAKYKNSDMDRHNMHGTTSQHSTNDKDYWEGKAKNFAPAQSGPLSKEWGVAHDDTVRPQRRIHHRARHSLRRGKAKDASKWRANVKKGRGFSYTAWVQGFEQAPGTVWWPGFIIPVYDYKYEIDSELLIKSVKFHRDWGHGSRTELSLTYPDAFSDKDGTTSGKGGRTAKQGSGAGEPQALADGSGLEADEN